MKYYVALEAKKLTQKTLSKALDSETEFLACENKEDALDFAQGGAMDDKNKMFILEIDFNKRTNKNAIINKAADGDDLPYEGRAFLVNQAKLKKSAIKVNSFEEVNMDPEQVNGFTTWQKVGLAAASTLVLGAAIFLFGGVPAAAAAAVAAKIGVSTLASELLVSGAAAVVSIFALATISLGLQSAYNWAFAPKVLNKEEYKEAVKNETKEVTKLEKKLKGAKGAALRKEFVNLLKNANDPKFDKDGKRKPEVKPQADKLVVAQWEHKKLMQLEALKGKELTKAQDKVLQKAKVKFI